MFRPLLWWGAFTLLFGLINLSVHFDARRDLGDAAAPAGLYSWAVSGFPKSDCIAGAAGGGATLDAFRLAFAKGLVFTGLVGGARTNQTYACLYGVYDELPREQRPYPPEVLPDNFTPIVPTVVSDWAVLQLILSLTLITLFLLAVRNHFRIR